MIGTLHERTLETEGLVKPLKNGNKNLGLTRNNVNTAVNKP